MQEGKKISLRWLRQSKQQSLIQRIYAEVCTTSHLKGLVKRDTSDVAGCKEASSASGCEKIILLMVVITCNHSFKKTSNIPKNFPQGKCTAGFSTRIRKLPNKILRGFLKHQRKKVPEWGKKWGSFIPSQKEKQEVPYLKKNWRLP